MTTALGDVDGMVSIRALEMMSQIRARGDAVSGRSDVVTEQLETAIGLGLLSPGERLPPEQMLADRLGVSPLTLRQSLAVLRSRGLVETRRGRGGGSFVTAPPVDDESRVDTELRGYRSEDLRDLVDVASATAGAAARLAAARADAQDVRRLRSLAARFAGSTDPRMLRQASARLHIGLGVAAQSRRLTSLLVQVEAEMSPLRGGSAPRDEHADAVRDHAGILDAIERGDAAAAEDRTVALFEREGALIVDRHLDLLTADLAAR